MTRPSLEFRQVDVFSAVPLKGNPLAVILDARALGPEQMQAIANWTNLSETTFVLPATEPGASYHLRIFTPRNELPFAGHPTLGSAHALLEAGLIHPVGGLVTQQCGRGLIPIRNDASSGRLYLKVPAPGIEPLGSGVRTRLEHLLGCPLVGPAAVVDLGPRWLTAELAGEEELLGLVPDMTAVAALSRELALTGLNLFARASAHIEVRSFAPEAGVPEDPVCGSGNASVAALLQQHGMRDSYHARQGRAVGRDGHVFIDYDAHGAIWLGGQCVTCATGIFNP